MKIKLLFLLLTYNLGFSQIKFEPGYFKDNAGNVMKCFIKNEDWYKNPTFIEIKTSENDVVIKKTIGEITEFAIDNTSKYIKATVDIDDFVEERSSSDYINNQKIIKKTVLLKVENEGNANLYSYTQANLEMYFFSKNNEAIKLLVFKEYIDEENKIIQNNSFKQLLNNELELDENLQNRLLKTNYTLNDLNDFFQIYNKNKSLYTNSKTTRNYKAFHLTLKAGAVFNSYKSLINENLRNYFSFPSQTNFGFGLELENILNFNKNKWSLIIETSYENFSSNIENTNTTRKTNISLKLLNIGFGVRHYMFINEKSSLFLNVGIQYVISVGDDDFTIKNTLIEIEKTNPAFMGGFGIRYNKKYSIEFRLRTIQDLTESYKNYPTSYNSSSLFLGYTIF